jgi:antitoxin ParD1/3/4
MPTRNINLTERLTRFVDAEVHSGRYASASEVVREGLRLMERRKLEERAKLKWLREAVKEGLDEIDHGLGIEFVSVEELVDEVERLGAEVSSQAAANSQRG